MVALAAALAGCGGGDDAGPLGPTAARLRSLERATLELELRASGVEGTEGEAVGFAVKGPFALGSPGSLPTARLESTRLVGTEEITSTLISTGQAAYVEVDGTAYTLSDPQAAALRAPTGDGDGPLDGLRLAQWVIDPQVEAVGGTEKVTGAADVPVVMADLFSVSAGFGVDGQVPAFAIGDEEAEVLRRSVRSSSAEVVSDVDDYDLRSLTVDIRLGTDLGRPDLDSALARYRGARIQFTVRLSDHGEPVAVEPPSDPKPAAAQPRR